MDALRVAKLTMKTGNVLERPRWRLAGKLPCLVLREAAEFGDRILDFARELRRAAVKFRFERRQSRLGAIEAVLRRVGGRDADFGQACGLFDELLDGNFVDKAERIPLLLD